MPKDLNGVTPTGGEVNTLCVALEVSGSSWVVAVGGPGEPDKQWHFIRPALRPDHRRALFLSAAAVIDFDAFLSAAAVI